MDHAILPDKDEGGKMIMRHGLLARLTVGSHVQQTTMMTITMTMTMMTIMTMKMTIKMTMKMTTIRICAFQ